jgi:2-polyprenyl-6-methoxyphenol hydroxylase-like FAD-dependent oxidoreductase
MHDAFIHDVVIAGAGPVGLFLACELRLAGVSVLALERAADPHSPLKRLPFGMRGLSSPTIDAFHRRGLLQALTMPHPSTEEAPPHWKLQPRAAGGHFAGIQFHRDRIDDSRWPWRLPGPVEPPLTTDMQHLETVLAARAGALGVQILRGVAVDGVEQSDDAVTISAAGRTLRARWLVACDGGRSTVRKAAGFTFAGTEPEFTGYSAEVEIAAPNPLAPGRHFTSGGMYTYQHPGIVAMADFDGGACHRMREITREHVQSVLRRVSGTDITLTALKLAATWTDRAFQAGAYRKGRVLLAGDAAHVHSPLGGQGLNLGLGDAMNLGWKLAATIRGDAPPGLLDSYHAERHPVGAEVLAWSRAQVAVMRPGPGSRALAAILAELIDTRDGATYVAERVWGVSLRYALGVTHPLAGRSAPEFGVNDGSPLGEHLREGRGVLVDFSATAALREIAGRHHRLDYLAGDAADTLGLAALLVRPDGVVAWAGNDAGDLPGLGQAAGRWFGRKR